MIYDENSPESGHREHNSSIDDIHGKPTSNITPDYESYSFPVFQEGSDYEFGK